MSFRLTQKLALAALLVVPTAPLAAQAFPAHCAGTYLIEEDGGAMDFWTFAADGTFFGTTSTQELLHFSNQQGGWKKGGDDGARGVLFAFVWDDDDRLLTVARIDLDWHSVGAGCGSIVGSLVVRTFEAGEDPLDPTSDTGDPIASDTFTGRRVKAGP